MYIQGSTNNVIFLIGVYASPSSDSCSACLEKPAQPQALSIALARELRGLNHCVLINVSRFI
jgi:hypothetical protein